jgi:ABC-type uncharacterized transport system substrate-binding protein
VLAHDSERVLGFYRVLAASHSPRVTPSCRSTRFELVINLKIAKLHDLEIPPRLLALADAVID